MGKIKIYHKELFANIDKPMIEIYYCWWGGHFKDRQLWTAITANGLVPGYKEGELWNYNNKKDLIEECTKLGYAYVVLRYKRNGDIEIYEQGGMGL